MKSLSVLYLARFVHLYTSMSVPSKLFLIRLQRFLHTNTNEQNAQCKTEEQEHVGLRHSEEAKRGRTVYRKREGN